jgi:hypothetical protein
MHRFALRPGRRLRNRVARGLLLVVFLLGGAVATAQGVGPSDPLPTFEVTLSPNYLHRSDAPASNYQAIWLYPTSPTTPYRSPDSLRHVQRYLLLDPRFKDADGRAGHDEWWFVIERYWPSSYQSSQHGRWGRQVNFHNVAGDAGPSGGVGWGFGEGTSSLALDWLPGRPAPQFTFQPMRSAGEQHEYPLPVPTRDEWQTYVVRFVAGRPDGSTTRAGEVDVWANGVNEPVIRLRDAFTVQRAKGPDGRLHTQRWMQLWEGDYTSGLQVPATTRLVLTRIGKTLAEAIADRPTLAGTNIAGQYYSGSGANYGPPSATQITSRTAGEARIPSSLLESPPPPDCVQP